MVAHVFKPLFNQKVKLLRLRISRYSRLAQNRNGELGSQLSGQTGEKLSSNRKGFSLQTEGFEPWTVTVRQH